MGVATAMAMPGVRIKMLSLFKTIEPQYTDMRLGETSGGAPEVPAEWEGNFYPLYIPDGFVLTRVDCENGRCDALYTNASGRQFVFGEFYEDARTNYDTEGAVISQMFIRGVSATLSQKDASCTLSWMYDNAYFLLRLEGESNEIVRIADSVIKIG